MNANALTVGFLQLTPYLAVALLAVLALLAVWRSVRRRRGCSCQPESGEKPRSRTASCGSCQGCAGCAEDRTKCH